MEFLHCNACGHIPQYFGQEPKRYFISSCGHVFCQTCVTNSKDTCAVCKSKCRVMEVNAQSKPDIKMYFMDPLTLLRDNLTKTIQVFNFQKSQQKSFQSIIGRLVEAHKRVVAENGHFKQGMEMLKLNNQNLTQRIEAMEQEHQNWIGSAGSNNSLPDAATPFFTLQGSRSTTPRNSFSSIFGDRGTGTDTLHSRGVGTPANKSMPFYMNKVGNQGTLFTPTPPPVNNSSSNHPSSGGPVHYGPGRLTNSRTPTLDVTPSPNRFGSPTFCAAPGSGRSSVAQTPDIVSRLRQLRCTTTTPSSSSKNTPTPASHSYMP